MRKLMTLIVMFAAWGTAAQADVTPQSLVHDTADAILAEIKKNRRVYASSYERLYKMAEEKVLPHFDFRRMSQLVLARHWRDATAEQRERFIAEFRDQLVATYSTALLNYKDQEIIYLPVPFKPTDTEALVKTEVKQGGGQPSIPIHYDFYKNKQGVWKVFDIKIDGTSIVVSYKAVYSEKIRKNGLDALIADIAANNRKKRGAGQ